MLAAVFQRPGQMEVTEVDTPEIGADEVSCQSRSQHDMWNRCAYLPWEKTRGIHPPTILGHEIAGKLSPGYRHWRSGPHSPASRFPTVVDIPAISWPRMVGGWMAPCLFPTEDTHIGSTLSCWLLL